MENEPTPGVVEGIRAIPEGGQGGRDSRPGCGSLKRNRRGCQHRGPRGHGRN